MADQRNRIGITLTDLEKAEIDIAAASLGVKSTRCIYEAYKLGLPLLIKQAQANQYAVDQLSSATRLRDLVAAQQVVSPVKVLSGQEKRQVEARKKKNKK